MTQAQPVNDPEEVWRDREEAAREEQDYRNDVNFYHYPPDWGEEPQ